jgi:putative transposase
LSLLEKLLDSQVSIAKPFENWLTVHRSFAIEHLPTKEGFIFKVFEICAVQLSLLLAEKEALARKKTLSTLVSLPKSKWTIFLDKLTSSSSTTDHATLATELLQILLLESISNEKVYRPFWTPAYKDASEKLSLPTETDYADSVSNSSTAWSQKLEAKSSFLTIKSTELANKSSQTISSPSSTFFPVAKWEKEAIPVAKLKTLKLRIHPTQQQKKLLDGFIHTSRYVYNKAIEMTKRGHKANFYDLRDMLVTDQSKKGYDLYKKFDDELRDKSIKMKEHKGDADKLKLIKEEINQIITKRRKEIKGVSYKKNDLIQPFELKTPKDIRASAVKRCCDAMKTGFSNLRNGNIKFFRMKFKKRTDKIQTIEITPKLISIDQDGMIKIAPETFGTDCYLAIDKHNARKVKNITISHNVDLSKTPDGYFLYIPIETTPQTNIAPRNRVCGVDLGVRTLGTVYSTSVNGSDATIHEYDHKIDLLRSLNKKIKFLKQLKRDKMRIRKKQIKKIEKKKKDLVDKMHWDFINDLLKKQDVVYIGDIKSHDIVKRCNNSTLNQDFNDLKFYVLKTRLLYKASVMDKRVFYIKEHYTTKTCSSCGQINNEVGSSKVFECAHCKLQTGRDCNAAKNMLLKGMFHDSNPLKLLDEIRR